MTCVVGVSVNNTIYIGADSCGADASTTMIVGNPKVFKVDNRFLIGVCGSFRAIDLLRFSLKVPDQKNETDDCFMRTSFINAVREMLKENEFDEDETINFMVGYKGNVYCVEPDLAVLNVPDWGHAIGNGGEPARGALWALKDVKRMSVENKILKALEAAEALCTDVRGPFVLENI